MKIFKELNGSKQKEISKVSYDIPFYTQQVDFTDSNLQGFKNKEDAEYWQTRGCGIASIKMIIDAFQKYRNMELCEPYGKLLYKGLERGAHCERGWIHNGLINLAKDYDIKGRSFREKTIRDIQLEIEKDRPCIASVSVAFNGGKLNDKGEVIRRGGHLIVVFGIVKEDGKLKGFIVNHPSSYGPLNLEEHFISALEFENSFSGGFMSFSI